MNTINIKKIKRLCESKQIKISLAESCTGGLVSSSITSIAGSSNFFDSAIISYSNKAKIELLGVNKNLILKYGAVSKEVALSMVKNLYRLTKSHICVSITGIAGPDGGTKKKPIGTVYFSIYKKIGEYIEINNYKEHFHYKNRITIQKKSNEFVIQKLISVID
jgi:PncC family amidohydrolase